MGRFALWARIDRGDWCRLCRFPQTPIPGAAQTAHAANDAALVDGLVVERLAELELPCDPAVN